jgi:GTP 3',8-cyclase
MNDAADHPALLDRFGRVHDYLRISLVDKCNLRCTYCMPENVRFLPQSQLMTADEILALAEVFVSLGVKKIRLTGGEPLLRKDFGAIVRRLGQLPVELALSTNAILLHEALDDLQAAGLCSINVSLDSLDAKRFEAMTLRDQYDQVQANIEMALQRGLRIKLNMVVMRGVNHDELPAFVGLTRHQGLHVRFIEFMPFDGNRWEWDKVYGQEEILRDLAGHYAFDKLDDGPNSTSRAYQVAGFHGTFAVISTVTAPFCEGCNRIRLTAEGKLRNCLFAREELDLLTVLRTGGDVRPLIRAGILAKAEQLGGLPDFQDRDALERALSARAMVKIGG